MAAGRARMLGYASGNFGKNVLASTMDVFLMFVLTERWGVSPPAAGLVVMIGLVWDGICDPLLGRMIDGATNRSAMYRGLLFLGAPFVGVLFAIFFVDPGWRGTPIVAWAVMTVVLFRTAYSVCDVAHNALMMRMTEAPGAAATLSGLRYMFSCLGALTVAGFSRTFVDPARDGSAVATVSLLAALAYVGTLWLAAASAPVSSAETPRSTHTAPISWITGNRPLLILLALGFTQALTLPFFARSFAYVGKGVVHDAGWTGSALTALAMSQLAALPVWMTVASRMARREILSAALIMIASGLGVFAIGGAAMTTGITLFGLGNAGLQMMIWVLLAEAIDHGERRTGVRLEGLPVALLLLSLKLGAGVSGALLGHGLSLIGWGSSPSLSAVEQHRLMTMAWILPMTGAIACLAIVMLPRPERRVANV